MSRSCHRQCRGKAFRQAFPLCVESFSKRHVARLSWIAFRANGFDSLHSSPSGRFTLDWIEILRIGGEFVGDDAVGEKRSRLPDATLQRLPANARPCLGRQLAPGSGIFIDAHKQAPPRSGLGDSVQRLLDRRRNISRRLLNTSHGHQFARHSFRWIRVRISPF